MQLDHFFLCVFSCKKKMLPHFLGLNEMLTDTVMLNASPRLRFK